MKEYRLLSILSIFTFIFIAYGCSGGGGDSATTVPSVQPLVYVGKTDPADITLENAPDLLVNVLYGGDSVSGVTTGVSLSSASNAAAFSKRLVALINFSMDSVIGESATDLYIPLGVDIDETSSCDMGMGYITLKGTVDENTGAATLDMSYVDCVIDGVTYNGDGTLTFYNFDVYTGSSSGSVEFVLLTMSGPDFSGSMSGIVYIDDNFYGNQYTQSMQLYIVAQDDMLNKMYKFDGYSMTVTIDDIYVYDPSSSIGYGGILYDSIYGGISIENYSPLTFSSYLNSNPDGGGPLTMIGNNSRMQLTVISEKHILLELDLDGNGLYETVRYVLWQEIDDHSNLNLADTDNDGMHDSWEELFGLDPTIDDAGDDSDTDTYLNLDEYQGGSNPQDMSSIPAAP